MRIKLCTYKKRIIFKFEFLSFFFHFRTFVNYVKKYGIHILNLCKLIKNLCIMSKVQFNEFI